MKRIKAAFWGVLALLSALWLMADPSALQPSNFLALRRSVVQYSGILAMACMSIAMILALRPRWPERWLGGLDKMYRLHKWLGIGALVVAIVHWLWAKGPKWAVGLGWLERPQRGPRPPVDNPIEQFLLEQRSLAESIGEWAFYAAVLLIAAALIRRIPYHVFYKTHRLLAPDQAIEMREALARGQAEHFLADRTPEHHREHVHRTLGLPNQLVKPHECALMSLDQSGQPRMKPLERRVV